MISKSYVQLFNSIGKSIKVYIEYEIVSNDDLFSIKKRFMIRNPNQIKASLYIERKHLSELSELYYLNIIK